MRVYKYCSIKILIILILFVLNHAGFAQDGIVIETIEKRFNEDVFYELFTENDIWDNLELRTKSFLEVDLIKLEKTANEIGSPPEIEKVIMYAQKDKIRVDNESAAKGKLTFIFRQDLGMVYQINWDMMTVTEMSVEASKKMTQGFQDKTDAMQANMEEMLKSVPPDKWKEMIEAMKASGQYKDSSTSKKAESQIIKTGRKKDINKFPQCEEYRVTYGDKNIALWATDAKPSLIKMINQIGQDFKSSFGMKDNDDIDS